ncbi:hypothetical protein FRC02_007528 [Tulasnella sp. 418]|nr:hypothetical protein FRC02_007528 [Tulasnella sp. 418]
MSPSTPLLGSQAIHDPRGQSKTVQVNETICLNLSLFKDLLKEYRKLDDAVTMRLNRNNAQFRDRERMGLSGRGSQTQDEACLYFWKELVENWKGRAEIINYCVQVVDKVMDERQQSIQGQEAGLDADRQLRAKLYADEVKV